MDKISKSTKTLVTPEEIEELRLYASKKLGVPIEDVLFYTPQVFEETNKQEKK